MGQALAPLRFLPATPPLQDARGRIKRKLRLSLTDRCNLRCLYCMPENPQWLPRRELLSRDEILRLARVFVTELGITELRLTGGEPTLRPDLVEIVAALGALRPLGLERIALTSNGARLARLAPALKAAGLDDCNISLDAVEPERFRALTRGELAPVLTGIAATQAAGIPIKLNTVVIRDHNEDQVRPLLEWARARGLPLRYIEFMPLDGRDAWRQERVVSEAEILERLAPLGAVHALPRGSDPASYYQLDDGYRFGVISTVSKPFCSRCDRVRIDARGSLYTCLFSAQGGDLRTLLRASPDDSALITQVRRRVWAKEAGYAARPGYVERPITMHHLGG